MNKIGKIIEVAPILEKHSKEKGCSTQYKICEYLKCQKGEVYVVFNDIDEIQQGKLCKIKEDACSQFKLTAFTKNDDDESRKGAYWKNVGYDLHAIVYLDQYRYIMRIH